ncbi:hypothetical protein WEH80_38690 [Actinomycetes bacterium KLBMP 9759]
MPADEPVPGGYDEVERLLTEQLGDRRSPSLSVPGYRTERSDALVREPAALHGELAQRQNDGAALPVVAGRER